MKQTLKRKKSDCRTLVLQNGARHEYAVPSAFATHGMLAGFYTDACGNQGVGRISKLLSALPVLGTSFRLLQQRRIPEQVLPYTHSFPLSSLIDQLFFQRNHRPSKSKLLGLSMQLAGNRDADIIYSSMGWSPSFLESSRRSGIKIVTEFYVRPSLWRVHQEEHLLFQGWESAMPYPHLISSKKDRRGPCDLSDELIAPTQAVKDDLINEGLFPADRIHVVPYGVGKSFFEIKNDPQPGNVLFVGSCTIIKGIHYLAKAAQHLSENNGPSLATFTAAGEVATTVRTQPTCEPIKFLGRVPRIQVRKLYADADLLVFPTLSDGFGAVLLEAMAAGVPVICSPYCAEVVEHGISGFIIEPRDTEALAEAIATIIRDRGLRESMSLAARKRAAEFTWQNHAENLVQVIRKIGS